MGVPLILSIKSPVCSAKLLEKRGREERGEREREEREGKRERGRRERVMKGLPNYCLLTFA